MKKRLSKIICLILTVCFVSSILACSNDSGSYKKANLHAAPEEIYSLTFDGAVGKYVMPVGVYGGPHAKEREYHGKTLPSMITDTYFDMYEEIGINLFTATLKDQEETEDFLSQCDKYGMGAFITFQELVGPDNAPYVTENVIERNLDKYSQHKSLVGFYLRDEPTVPMVEKMSNTVNALNNSAYADKMLAYVNAFPEYAGSKGYDKEGSAMSWETYLETICEQLDVKFLSFDFYPWYSRDDGTEYYNSGYIKALSIARKVANKYKIPLWSCKQCGSVMEFKPLSAQAMTPNAEKFRWQMTLDLAFGVKGFTYFLLCGDNMAYAHYKDADGKYAYWQEGMDDYFGLFNGYTGQPNVWYDYAKEFKGHVQLVDEILMNSYHDGIILNGGVIEKGNFGAEVIKSGTYYELTGVEGGASVIGCYNYNGRTVLYVTNNSYSKSNSVMLKFSDNYGYDVYQGNAVTEQVGKQLTLELKAGEGAMIALKY